MPKHDRANAHERLGTWSVGPTDRTGRGEQSTHARLVAGCQCVEHDAVRLPRSVRVISEQGTLEYDEEQI